MRNVFIFNAGPSVLPEPVLESTSKAILNFAGTGMSIMEVSHRSKQFDALLIETVDLLKKVMQIPDNYKVLFLQGGATMQFAMIPINLLASGQGCRLHRHRLLRLPGHQGSQVHRQGECRCIHQGPELHEAAQRGRDQAHQGRSILPHYVEQHHLRHPVADIPGYGQCAAWLRTCLPTSCPGRSMCRNSDLSMRAHRRTWGLPASPVSSSGKTSWARRLPTHLPCLTINSMLITTPASTPAPSPPSLWCTRC